MNRADILDEAKALTCGQRAETYGDFVESYRGIATMISGLLAHKLTAPLTASEAMMIQVMVKAKRAVDNPRHGDSFPDGSAYFAGAGEAAAADAE